MAWRGLTGPPASYLIEGSWPSGRVQGPAEVHVVRALCQRLEQASRGLGVRELARQAGLNHSTLRAVRDGQAWPDVITVARLETALDTDLWPGRIEG